VEIKKSYNYEKTGLLRRSKNGIAWLCVLSEYFAAFVVKEISCLPFLKHNQ